MKSRTPGEKIDRNLELRYPVRVSNNDILNHNSLFYCPGNHLLAKDAMTTACKYQLVLAIHDLHKVAVSVR